MLGKLKELLTDKASEVQRKIESAEDIIKDCEEKLAKLKTADKSFFIKAELKKLLEKFGAERKEFGRWEAHIITETAQEEKLKADQTKKEILEYIDLL